MPSAASVKVDKPPTTTNSANNAVATNMVMQGDNIDNSSPIRQVSLIIEHKIRNLEKRKSKLESYRDLEKTGKDLSADKKVAILKYDEVAMTLDFAREFSKQIEKIVLTSEKDLKKKQKKDEVLKKQGETSKIREVLIIQDVLKQLTDETVRNDFLAGTNGACQLDQSELELLDLFSSKIIPKRATEVGGIPFKTSAQKSADHLSLTIDGKQKEFESSTYANVKTLLKNIQKCAYFDKASQPPPVPQSDVVDVEVDVDVENIDSHNTDQEGNVELENVPKNTAITSVPIGETTTTTVVGTFDEKVDTYVEPNNNIEYQEAPSASAVPVPTFPPQQQQHSVGAASSNVTAPPTGPQNLKSLPQIVQQPNILASPSQQVAPGATIQMSQVAAVHQIHGGHVQPTTVRAVEQAYFKQHQYIHQMRPLAEVLGAGNFFFLQESELDSPDINTVANNSAQQQPQNLPPNLQTQQQQQQPPQQPPSLQPPQIPTQTFTNQSFTNVVYTNIKPTADVPIPQAQQQQHIPGFATPNAPIPIPIVQPAPITAAPSLQQQQQQQQQPSNSPNASQMIVQQQLLPQAMNQFPVAGKFIAPTNVATPAKLLVDNMVSHELHANVSSTIDINEQNIPEISEWIPEDGIHVSSKVKHSSIAHHHHNHHHSNKDMDNSNGGNSNAWRDPYAAANKDATESNEWNGVPNENGQEESNTWSSNGGNGSSNQRYQYRQGSGGYRNNRSSGRNAGNSLGSGVTNSATNGYRGRPNSSYNNSGGGNSTGSGGGSRSNGNGNNSNSFYRNSDSYYQQNGSRADKLSSSDTYNSRSGGNNNYRSRESRENNSTYKAPQRGNNNQNSSNSITSATATTISNNGNRLNNGDNIDRGHNNNSINNNQPNLSHRSSNNNTNASSSSRGINTSHNLNKGHQGTGTGAGAGAGAAYVNHHRNGNGGSSTALPRSQHSHQQAGINA